MAYTMQEQIPFQKKGGGFKKQDKSSPETRH